MLSACVQSVLETEGVEVEVVIVANACDELLPVWIEGAPRAHVLRTDHAVGFSVANNLAVDWYESVVDGADAYLFLNSDARVEADTIAALYEVLTTDPGCAAVGPEIRIWGAADHLNSLGLNVTEFGEAWDEGIGRPVSDYPVGSDAKEVLALTGAVFMVRAPAFKAVGGWARIYRYYMEDIDLCLRLRARGWTVKNCRRALALHAISATSGEVTDMKRFYSWRNQFVLLAIHWPPSLLLRVAPRLAAAQLGVFLRRVRAKAYHDARLQLRSWLGAARLLPTSLRDRRRIGSSTGWTQFLLPAGIVPVIELPVGADRPWHNDLVNRTGDRSREAGVIDSLEES